MKISAIKATSEQLIFTVDTDGEVAVHEHVPTVGGKPGRTLAVLTATAENGRFSLPRFEGHHDRIYSRFAVTCAGEPCQGVIYVTDIAEDVPENVADYPQPSSIKVLGVPKRIDAELHIQQGLTNVNLPNLMATEPGEGKIAYNWNGRTYYFIQSAVEAVDRTVMGVPMITMILLNSPRLFGSTGEKALLDSCIHPGYDWDSSNAFISAFDMQTEEGQGYFGAFCEFLAERYTRPDKKYGRAVGFIVSNEVNSQYVWGNAGEMTVDQYTHEYSQAMRLAWLCARKHCSYFRVYISLDQFWAGVNFDGSKPLRYYSDRPLLEKLNAWVTTEGNYPWNVAFHPYPEDLSWPDFWNDRAPDFTFNTPKITFKNMEVLEAFLGQEAFLYKGEPRRIIFSEQGFNSRSDELKELTEQMAAAGYVLAFMKARNMKTVDLFTHHASVDNPHEFGLNLGAFRFDPNSPDRFGEPKPIYASIKAMDTPDEAAAIEKARAFIGEELFEYLLHPTVICADHDTTDDVVFC